MLFRSLHDIGHGPFSHISEQLLKENTDNIKELLDKHEADNIHELISILIIQGHDEICEILDETTRNKIIKLLKKRQKGFLEKDIISGPLDADKLDYILRDTYFTGVRYGIFDIEKIIESMTPIEISSTEKRIGLGEEGVYALEQFLLANYHMKMQVYYHRIRRIADAMLTKGVEFAIREGVEGIKELFTIKEDENFLHDYVKYNDYLLIEKLSQEGDISRDYFTRLKKRALFKEICTLELTKRNLNADTVTYNKIKSMGKNEFWEMSKNISIFLKDKYSLDIKPEFIIIDRQTFTNPTFKSPGKIGRASCRERV